MKLIGNITSGLFLLIVIVFVILQLVAKNINLDSVKQRVSEQITLVTHKPSHIQGTIAWQFLPRPGLKISKIVIGNEQGLEEYSLTIDNLFLNLKMTPLLKRKFIFNKVNIAGLKMRLNLDAEPEDNLNQIPAPTLKTKLQEYLSFEKLLINRGQLIIQSDGVITEFTHVQIGFEQFNDPHFLPYSIQVKAKLNNYQSNPKIRANINFKGRLNFAWPGLYNLKTKLSQSNIEGQLLVQNVFINQLAVKKINATIKTNSKGVTFNPFTLSLYNGESVGDMNYVSASQEFFLNQTATNLNGKLLLKNLLGKDILSGALDYSIRATIPFKNFSIETSAAKGTFTIKNGEIYSLNLEQLLFNTVKYINNRTKVELDPDRDFDLLKKWDSHNYKQGATAFKLANVQFQLQGRQLKGETILVQADKFQLKGQGTINLANFEINSALYVITNPNIKDLKLQKAQEQLGGSFPLLITGTLLQPEIQPNFKVINPFLSELLRTITLTDLVGNS